MKHFFLLLVAVLVVFAFCACTGNQQQPATSEPAADESEIDLVDALYPFTLKETAKLVVGEDTFDVKTVIELKDGHNMDEIGFSIASDESVASIDDNGILTRKGYGQVSVSICKKDNPAQFNLFNATFAPANLYGTTYKGGFSKADGTLGNEITLVLNTDNSFTLNVGAGQAKYLDNDYDIDSKAVGEFTGTYEVDAASATPVLLTSSAYSSEPVKAAFGKNTDGAFCIRIKLNSVTVDGELKTTVIDLAAQ